MKQKSLLKRFIHYYRPYRRELALDMAAAFMVSVFDMVYPLMTRSIINDLVPDRNLRMIIVYCAALLLIYLAKRGCNYYVSYRGHVIGVNMQSDMRRDIFAHLESLPFSYFDDNRSGALMSRVVNDLQDVSELAHHGPENLFLSAFMILGSFVILCTINISLTLIIFLFLPILILFVFFARRDMSRMFTKTREKTAQINADLGNSLSGVRVSKAFDNEQGEIDRFERSNCEYRTARSAAFKAMGHFQAGMTFYIDLLYLAVITGGGLYFYFGIINLGDFTAYLLYITFFISPVRKLMQFFEMFEDGKAGFRRFCEVMDEQPETDKPSARDVDTLDGDIVFNNVSFTYGNDKQVLTDLNLTVKQGEKLALVGPSGGGKTTLCHLLPRFYPLSSGSITIGGTDITDIKLGSLRRNIGLVQQEVFLFTGTIAENIGYIGREASRDEVVEAAKKANIHDFVMTLPDGYETYIGERGVKLSGGQKQRIAIARIFLKNPSVVVLDEATSALDNATEAQLQASLDEMCVGRTSIVVAHRLSTVKNADKIVVITENGLEEQGTHEQLMATGKLYRKLYEMQFRQ